MILAREKEASMPGRVGEAVTWSPSLTLAITHACPWRCGYCGFRDDAAGLMADAEIDRLLSLAEQQGAREILVIAGEDPDRLPRIRKELQVRGYKRFLDFALDVCRRALERGFLPHSNLGALDEADWRRLREVNASCGLMLENVDEAFNCTVASQKTAAGRLASIEAAGRARVPFTSGILIGLGESHASRLASLDALAEVHTRYGHLQEIIIQNYIPNEGSRLGSPDAPTLADYLKLIEHWRAIAPDVAVQIPPNLNPHWRELLPYIDDLGGVSAEGDVVNPGSPWDAAAVYAEACDGAGRQLAERLPVYPQYVSDEWLAPETLKAVAGLTRQAVASSPAMRHRRKDIWHWSTPRLHEEADALNRRLNGDVVTYVVNRNANFTNVCNVGCAFCGFQRKASDADAYTREPEEMIARLASTPEITEVCMQGGINPALGFAYYEKLVRALKAWRADLHIHAFSPMEIDSLHRKTGWAHEVILGRLRDAGLDTVPGTAAEILDDEVRGSISSRKLGAERWGHIIRTAHRLGLRSTATIMYGHIETWAHIRRHFETLLRIQEETGGFTEFIPLQFIPHENPLGHRIRPDAAAVEAKAERLYCLARLYFGEALPNLQTSWVKLGVTRATESLAWGCNDFGGTLYEESITKASGGTHGEYVSVERLRKAITGAGRVPRQRQTVY